MNASSFLVLTLAVFGASAAPSCFNLGSSFGSSNQLTLAAAPLTLTAAPSFGSQSFSAGQSCGSQALALPASFSSQSSGLSAPSCVSPIQGQTAYLQTGLTEGANTVLPAFIPPTSITKSCHCLKTFVRPQVRTEVITVPTVDRLTRIVNNPVVEVVSSNAGGHNRHHEIPSCGSSSGQAFAAAPAQAFAAAPAQAFAAAPAQLIAAAPAQLIAAAPAQAFAAAPAQTEFLSGSFERGCGCNNNLLL